MSDDPVSAEVGRTVRLLAAIGVPGQAIEAVTGCPVRLVPEVAAGRLGGEYDADAIRADVAIVAAVDQARGLIDETEAGQADSIEDLARWLAEQSEHPRYVQVRDGWKRLLTSTADVEVAFNAATKRLGDGPGFRASERVDWLRSVRDALRKVAKAAEEAAEQ